MKPKTSKTTDQKIAWHQAFAAGLCTGVILATVLLMLAGCRHIRAIKTQAEWRGLLQPSLDPKDHDFTPPDAHYPYQTIKGGKEQREVIIQYFKDLGLEPPTEKK